MNLRWIFFVGWLACAVVVQQGMPGSPRSPGSRGGRRRQHQELARRLRAAAGATNAREAATELAAITSVEELEIDYDQALSIKRGDLAIIQGEVCTCACFSFICFVFC